MLSRRPESIRTRGVVVPGLLGICLTLTACGQDAVEVATPGLSRADGTACARLLDALPERLVGLEPRETTPTGASARAWGDPAVVVECGTPVPAEFDALATCQEIDGVEWFVPADQIADQSADVVMSTIGYVPGVTVRVPAQRRPPTDVFVELAPVVRESLRHVSSCGGDLP